MNLVLAVAIWLAMGAVLTVALVLAVTKGNPWLLVAGLVAFVVAIGRIGCMK
jgi:hypothetical protein